MPLDEDANLVRMGDSRLIQQSLEEEVDGREIYEKWWRVHGKSKAEIAFVESPAERRTIRRSVRRSAGTLLSMVFANERDTRSREARHRAEYITPTSFCSV